MYTGEAPTIYIYLTLRSQVDTSLKPKKKYINEANDDLLYFICIYLLDVLYVEIFLLEEVFYM